MHTFLSCQEHCWGAVLLAELDSRLAGCQMPGRQPAVGMGSRCICSNALRHGMLLSWETDCAELHGLLQCCQWQPSTNLKRTCPSSARPHLMLLFAAPRRQWKGLFDSGVPGFLLSRSSRIQASMYLSPSAKLRTCLSRYTSGALPLLSGAVVNCLPPHRPVVSAQRHREQTFRVWFQAEVVVHG